MRWPSLVLLLFALTVGACSSDPTAVVSGSDNTADTSETADADAEQAPASNVSSTTTTHPVANDSAPIPLQSGIDALEPLGPAMVGGGEWAVLRPEMANEGEGECRDGVLAYVLDGKLIHTYHELSFAGGIRLFPGPRGQDVFVINCEETVDRIAFAGSAVLTEFGWPEIVDIIGAGAQGVTFAFSGDFGWYGDLFGGHGSHADGVDALFVIDPAALTIVPLESLVGERQQALSDGGISLVTPTTWSYDGETFGELVASTTSNSRVQAWVVTGFADTPLGEGDELLSSGTTVARLWDNSDAARVTTRVQAKEWTFRTPDGIRVIRHIPREQDTVVVEMFSDSDDSSIDDELPWIVLELVRVDEAAS